MRIRMLETRRGTEDGFTIRQYHRDEIYDIADPLARAFFAAGFAIPEGNRPIPFSKKPRRKKSTTSKR